jgi:hypothetical protein
MKKYLKQSCGISAAILTLIIAQSAQAIPATIYDEYVGGDDHNWGDVIGSKTYFDTHSMTVDLVGNMLSVSIHTNFAGRSGDLFGSLTSGNGIGYGDLFLSSSWNPYGAAPYTDDNSFNGTDWSYAFSLDDRWTEGGTGSLYSLNANDNNDILLSENFLTGGTFRNGQEVAVNTDGKTAIKSGINWDVTADTNGTDGRINFLIDLTDTDLAGSDTIALHWGMTCGNDTIEGKYSVPEPAMLGLLSLGLIGIGVSKRKRA